MLPTFLGVQYCAHRMDMYIQEARDYYGPFSLVYALAAYGEPYTRNGEPYIFFDQIYTVFLLP